MTKFEIYNNCLLKTGHNKGIKDELLGEGEVVPTRLSDL